METLNLTVGTRVRLDVPNFFWKKNFAGGIDILFPQFPEELYNFKDEWKNLPMIIGDFFKEDLEHIVINVPKSTFFPKDSSGSYFQIKFLKEETKNLSSIKESPEKDLLDDLCLN